MIARQRQNLTLTFAAETERNRSSAVLARLSNYETQIAEATQELADGLAQLGQFMPELEDALREMQKAISVLPNGQLDAAVTAEQTALQHLIRARQNVRKMLSQPNSQQASECRKFDRQQRQKLRTPEQVKKDREQQLAESRQQLDQLAQKQREWSEELKQSNASNDSQKNQQQQKQESQKEQQQKSQSQSQSQSQSKSDSQSQSSSSQAQSAKSAAERQQELLDALEKLRERLAKNQGSTEAGEKTADLAEEAMRRGLEELQGAKGDDAAESGQEAAEHLERLAAHLAAMNARDFGERLDRSQQLAEQLAGQQQKVAEQLGDGGEPKKSTGDRTGGDKSQSSQQQQTSTSSKTGKSGSEGSGKSSGQTQQSLARQERRLAAEADMLNELLNGLRADGLGEKSGIARELDEVSQANSPAQSADEMRGVAEHLDAKRPVQAAASAQYAAQQLSELAGQLKGLRGRFAQPQLEELLALENQLAQIQEQLRRGVDGAEGEQVIEQWQKLEPQLETLSSADPRLADALKELQAASHKSTANGEEAKQSGSTESGSPNRSAQSGNRAPLPPGLYWMKLGANRELREVAKAVQVKIQEAILAAALQDADEPVPPAYKQLVDEYYKALSDDLR